MALSMVVTSPIITREKNSASPTSTATKIRERKKIRDVKTFPNLRALIAFSKVVDLTRAQLRRTKNESYWM